MVTEISWIWQPPAHLAALGAVAGSSRSAEVEIPGATGLSRLRRGRFSEGTVASLTPPSASAAPTAGAPCARGWTRRTLGVCLMQGKKSEFKVIEVF